MGKESNTEIKLDSHLLYIEIVVIVFIILAVIFY